MESDGFFNEPTYRLYVALRPSDDGNGLIARLDEAPGLTGEEEEGRDPDVVNVVYEGIEGENKAKQAMELATKLLFVTGARYEKETKNG